MSIMVRRRVRVAADTAIGRPAAAHRRRSSDEASNLVHADSSSAMRCRPSSASAVTWVSVASGAPVTTIWTSVPMARSRSSATGPKPWRAAVSDVLGWDELRSAASG